MLKKLCVLCVLLMLPFNHLKARAYDLPALFTLELKREFHQKWSTLALEIIKNKTELASEILILSQSVATIWVDDKPYYIVVELYHVHEKETPVTIRVYSKTGALPLDPRVQPQIKVNSQLISFAQALEFTPESYIWSGIFSAETLTRFMRCAKGGDQLNITLALENDQAITGLFSMSGLDTSFTAGFHWKLHYRPFWEATRLGRFSFEPH